LYKKALNGEIKNFTGISDPYEEPHDPEVIVETHIETQEESIEKIIVVLKSLGYISRTLPYRITQVVNP
jgi:adenylylsulfate kinase-like enzyme